jgi:hypothetical protein
VLDNNYIAERREGKKKEKKKDCKVRFILTEKSRRIHIVISTIFKAETAER